MIKKMLVISDAEWEVMRVLWAHNSMTSRKIINTLLDILDWKEGTIKSLLNRLVTKKAIKVDRTQSPFRYSPNITQKEANQYRIDHVMNSICNTHYSDIIEYLIRSYPLSYSDYEQLKTLISTQQVNAPKYIPCQCLKGQCDCHFN